MRDRQRRDPQERDAGGDGTDGAEPDGSRPRAHPYEDAAPAPGSARIPDRTPDHIPDRTPGRTPDPVRDSATDPPPLHAAEPDSDESGAARRRRRAQFLRELNEAKALRERVKPRQARAARMRQQMRMRTFRW